MAGEASSSGAGSGPGNKIIATTALEWLAVRGRSVARDRAARALALDEAELGTSLAWLADDAIANLLTAGEINVGFARALGHRLVAPEATGIRLYDLGLATPEKAYRRVEALLPRESARAHWFVESIEQRAALIRFEPAPSEDGSAPAPRRSEEGLCALRKGMLEAIPGLFGLLPAEVHETSCRASGDDVCRYRVRWQVSSYKGTWRGLAIGSGAAFGIVVAALWLGGGAVPVAGALGSALAVLAIGASLGRVNDLQRQLEAVAGARRGQLALFDQVDDALAAKLDALARAETKLDGEVPASPVLRSAPGGEGGYGDLSAESQRGVLAAASQIHAAAGDLECWFDAGAKASEPSSGAPISDERGLVREIRDWAARIGRLASEDGEEPRARVDLTAVVGRAIATARPSLPSKAVIEVESDPELRGVECEPVQIEHLVMQLVQNAVEASVELSGEPEVRVTLMNATRGVEIGVEDRGVGIESSQIDEVFDPFFGDRPAGASGGLGLNVCLRIIERHGGELRIENEDRAGTRVVVWLPESSEKE